MCTCQTGESTGEVCVHCLHDDARHGAVQQCLEHLDHEDEARDEQRQRHDEQNDADRLLRQRRAVKDVITCGRTNKNFTNPRIVATA